MDFVFQFSIISTNLSAIIYIMKTKQGEMVAMESTVKTKRIKIRGMTCVNCQRKIQKKLRNTAGMKKADVDYNSAAAVVVYDTDILSYKDITAVIEKLNYEVAEEGSSISGARQTIGILVTILVLYMLLQRFGILNLLAPSRLAETDMSYGMLFVIGLITSVHCIAMCGGINLSQCIPRGKDGEDQGGQALGPAFLYNLGRVISYTAVGFLVGALGSVITFSNNAQGILKLAAGGFMIIMGINMLGIFPGLRKLNPRMPAVFARKIDRKKAGNKSPLIVGLLNGLMPCGPLQAMQIYALSTGSPLSGALSMFLFSLGTVPLMFGIGALSTLLSKKFSRKMMTAGAVLVVVLGLSMLSQGWSLAGFQAGQVQDTAEVTADDPQVTADDPDRSEEEDVQVIHSTLSRGGYPEITVRAGIPVKWVIDAPEGSINGCNNRMFIYEYEIEHAFQTGENIIEFTPENTGTFGYSCWMGMIRSSITVVE